MKTIIITATAAAWLSIGVAQARSPDNAITAEHMQSSDGAVGAMQAYTSGTATSPDDVMQQQRGGATVAQPSRQNRVGVRAVFYAPGTVGAAPGSADGR